MDTTNIVNRIIETTDKLQDYYWQRVDQGDTKAAASIESCCEISIKLLTVITKPDIVLTEPTSIDQSSNQKMVDLSKLTDQALTEIYDLLNAKSKPEKQSSK